MGRNCSTRRAADLDVDRPNKLRAVMRSSRSERELVYDGKRSPCTRPAQKYYSTVEFSGIAGRPDQRLAGEVRRQLPLSDLFLWGTPAAQLDKLESAMNAGQDFVGGDDL